MPVILDQVPIADSVTIGAVEITHCRKGYARVVLKPLPKTTDNLPVFLHKVDTQWSIIDFGTDLECAHQRLTPEMSTACQALGPP